MKINEARRTVPSFKLLKDSNVYDILIRKSSTIQLFCDCYQLQSLQKNTVFSRQKGIYTQCTSLCGLFVYKKREIFEPHRLEILRLHTGCVSSLWCVPPCSPNRDPIHFEFVYYSSFLSIHFGTEITNTLIHSRSSIENDTPFQTNDGQNVYPFSDQNG